MSELESSSSKVSGAAYKRVLLKLSGNCFCRSGESGITMAEVPSISKQIRRVHDTGVEIAIVCGGGNILRGRDFAAFSASINPPTAHYMGMLATCINGLALQDALENVGVPTRLQTAIRMEGVAEPFIRRRCVRHLEKGRVVILASRRNLLRRSGKESARRKVLRHFISGCPATGSESHGRSGDAPLHGAEHPDRCLQLPERRQPRTSHRRRENWHTRWLTACLPAGSDEVTRFGNATRC